MHKNTIIIGIAIIVLLAAVYFFTQRQIPNVQSQKGEFSTSIDGLQEAKSQETVELKNGDSYNLTANVVRKNINGRNVRMLAYNGSIPGPIIKVPQGGEITINFKNNADIDSTIHSHGVRVSNEFDGVVDVTQKVVKVGETFSYKLKFPDAGVFWYHPHFRDDYGQEMGLYGNYIVVPEDKSYYSPVNREITLFLDDILLEGDKIASFNKAISNRTLMGRFGNTMFLNGEANYALQVNAGEVVRFYLTNAANARVFNFSIPGAKMKLVGGDNGKFEREEFVDSLLLSNSERAIIEVLFDKSGLHTIENKTPDKNIPLGTITVSDIPVDKSYASEFISLRTNQDVLASIEPFRMSFNKPVDKSLTLSLLMSGMNSSENEGGSNMHMMHDGSMMSDEAMSDTNPSKIEWEDTMGMMNVMSNSEMVKWKLVDSATNQSNMDINWQFKKGDKVKIKIFNDPKSQHPMQHPIHIHGQRFLVLSTNNVPTQNMAWKDTVLVQTGDIVEILVDMENPGVWMLHCHIPEHIESGMMLGFKVI